MKMPWQCLGISFFCSSRFQIADSIHHDQENMITPQPNNYIFPKNNYYFYSNFFKNICISHFFVVSLYYKIRTTLNNNIMNPIIIAILIWISVEVICKIQDKFFLNK